jgi:hypothetical protein
MHCSLLLVMTLLGLSHITPVTGAPACVTCLLGCFETAAVCLAAGPAGSAACFLLCEAVCVAVCLSPACFHRSTRLLVRPANGSAGFRAPIGMSVADIATGDLVQTIGDDNDTVWTEVIYNLRSTAPVRFINLTTLGGSNLLVTPTHVLAVTPWAHAEAAMQLRSADAIQMGDALMQRDGVMTRIVAVGDVAGDTRYTLVTRLGTVLADGVLVPTMCDDSGAAGGDFGSGLAKWRDLHHPVFRLRSAA